MLCGSTPQIRIVDPNHRNLILLKEGIRYSLFCPFRRLVLIVGRCRGKCLYASFLCTVRMLGSLVWLFRCLFCK
jgi:hypothetical protein